MQKVTDLADPRRCKAASCDGQCRNVAEDGDDYCRAHLSTPPAAPARRMRKYLLVKAEDQALLARYVDDDDLKSLREEIALVRMMIQNTLADAQTNMDRINAYSKVNTYMLTLERVMKTSHALEKSLDQLVSKSTLIRLGKQLCHIILDKLEGVPNYEQLVDALIPEIALAVQNISNAESESGTDPETESDA